MGPKGAGYFDNCNAALLDAVPAEAGLVLEVGCGRGSLGAAFKARHAAATVYGVELDAAAASVAAGRLDMVLCGRVEALDLSFLAGRVDCVVYGDVLEHLHDPWSVLASHRSLLAPAGRVVASIPNVQHHSLLAHLLQGGWTYADHGLLDDTHLRFFTLASLHDLFARAGLRIESTLGLLASPQRAEAFAATLAPALAALGVDRDRFVASSAPLHFWCRAWAACAVARFHVLHWIPDPRLHIFNGYNEVIETLIWGLRALGHEASYAVNQLGGAARPIVFGAQLMPQPVLARLPAGSILYNLEQLPGLRATGRTLDDLAWAGRRFAVWDYSSVNLAVWRELGVAAAQLPVGYAPCLSRIDPAAAQDIDVLVYGAPSASRFTALAELCALGWSAMFVCGLYGAARDALIARARLVLCLTSNPDSSIFSIVRASYLLANRKPVVGDIAAAERDVAEAVAFAPLAVIAERCSRLLADAAERAALAERGFAVMARRDIRPLLARALRAADGIDGRDA